MTSVIKPTRLRPGDTIGIAAPGSVFKRELFLHGLQHIQEIGYKISFRPDIFSRKGYLAGSDERRATELNLLFADSRIKAIFCARGGYGSQRLLPLLDKKVICANPKIFMGYSDITALHTFLHEDCGLVTFHGPLVTEIANMEAEGLERLLLALNNTDPWGELAAGCLDIVRGGSTEGIIIGGSLTIFTQTLGTRYEPKTDGRILFFEDRGEKPYAVDRLISHLKLAGKFDKVTGLVLGQFLPPGDWPKDQQVYLKEIKAIVLDLLGEFNFPILSNLPAGHINGNICFPLGVSAMLDGTRGKVTIIEPCISA